MPSTMRVNPLLRTDILANLPLCVCAVFSFEGPNHETLLQNLNEFYASSDVPENRRPKLIIVNNGYLVERTGPEGGETRGGMKVAPHSFYAAGFKSRFAGSIGLVSLLGDIQAASNIGSQVLFNFDDYINHLPT